MIIFNKLFFFQLFAWKTCFASKILSFWTPILWRVPLNHCCLSVHLPNCLPVRLSVRRWLNVIFWFFWLNGRYLEYVKTDRALFFRKILFCTNFCKKGPKWPQNRGFFIFLILLLFTTNLISGKILVLELWVKMLSANQIAEFFKM